jgi:acyl dehydratase
MDVPALPVEASIVMSLEAILAFGKLVRDRAPFPMPDVRQGHHADVEAARSVGLRGPVAYSLHYYAIVAELAAEAFGDRWIDGGELDMAFLRPVCAGDQLVIRIGARPVQRPSEAAENHDRVQVDVYNQLDELVAAGSLAIAPA